MSILPNLAFLRSTLLMMACLAVSGIYGQRTYQYLPYTAATIDSLSAKLSELPTDDPEYINTALLLATRMYRMKQEEQAVPLAEQALGVARAIGRRDLMGSAYLTLAELEAYGKEEKVEIYTDSALLFLDEEINDWEYAMARARRGQYLASRDRCEEGLGELEKADSLTIVRSLPVRIERHITSQLLLAMRSCGVHERIPPIVRRTLREAKGPENAQNRFFLYDLAMSAFGNMDERDSARYYMDTMEVLLPKIGLIQNYGSYYANASTVAYELEDYEEAHRLAKLGLEFAEKYRPIDRYRVGKWSVIAAASRQLGRYEEALVNAEKAANYLDRAGQKRAASDMYEIWGDAALALGRLDQGQEALARGRALSDSLSLVAHRARIDSLMLAFDTERTERRLVQSELARARAERRVSKNQSIIFALLGLFILTGGALLLVRAGRRRRQLEYDKKQAELRYNLLRAQMNPHFIFNSLNSIQSFFSNQRFSQGNEFLGAFSQLVRRVLEQTGQKAISLAEELETLELYLKLEKIRLGNTLDFNIFLGPEVEMDDMRVPPLIFQPFVENAIWHGIAPKNGPGTIDVYVDYDEARDALLARIEDDGLGMQPKRGDLNKGHRSRGVEITRERLGVGGHIEIRNRQEGAAGTTGVRTELIIPLWE